jgi:WD40 repeat protein
MAHTSTAATYLAAVGVKYTVRVWNADTFALLGVLGELVGHYDTVTGLSFSPDSRFLASSAYDGTVILWNLSEMAEEISFDERHPVLGISFSTTGELLAVQISGQINIRHLGSQSIQKVIYCKSRCVSSVCFSADNKRIFTSRITADHENMVRVWDVCTGEPVLSIEHCQEDIAHIAASPTGDTAATAYVGGAIIIWDILSGVQRGRMHGHTATVNCICFDSTGDELVSCSSDSTVYIWNVKDYSQLSCFRCEDGVHSVSFSPDNRFTACGLQMQQIQIFDTITGTEVIVDPKLEGLRVRYSPASPVVLM